MILKKCLLIDFDWLKYMKNVFFYIFLSTYLNFISFVVILFLKIEDDKVNKNRTFLQILEEIIFK